MKYLPILLTVLILGCGDKNYPPLDVVNSVDINRYLGKWYEIARLPNSFQEDCFCSTAEYTIIDESTIKVVNKCRTDSINGEIDDAEGKAFIVPNSNNAKLKVQFQWPFKGDYWIIDLDEKDYSYAVVGTPSRKYLWILSRTPEMDTKLYEELVTRAKVKGFNVGNLLITEQTCK